jgi:undecaprenyl-diphosphatase
VKSEQLLLVLSAVQLALFAPLAWLVHKHATLPIDILLSRAMQKRTSRLLRTMSVAISYTGEVTLLNLLVIPIAVVLWKVRRAVEAMMLAGTCWTGALFRVVLQLIVNRPRPNPLVVRVAQKPKGKSFPSGHVVASVTFWGWLFILGLQHLKGQQKGLLSLPALLMTWIGPARIYSGQHWTSDVVGGYLLGGAWLGLSLRLYLALQRKNVVAQAGQEHLR